MGRARSWKKEEKKKRSKTSGSGPEDRKRWFRDAGQAEDGERARGWVVLCRPWDKP